MGVCFLRIGPRPPHSPQKAPGFDVFPEIPSFGKISRVALATVERTREDMPAYQFPPYAQENSGEQFAWYS
jgi:hypothetical protein